MDKLGFSINGSWPDLKCLGLALELEDTNFDKWVDTSQKQYHFDGRIRDVIL